MRQNYGRILFLFLILLFIFLSGCIQQKYTPALCNELANELDNVAMNRSQGNEFVGGLLISEEPSHRYYGDLIGVNALVFEGINNRLSVMRIDDGQGPFQIGAFYKFNLTNIYLYDPLSGAYGSPAGFSDENLNRLEEINCTLMS